MFPIITIPDTVRDYLGNFRDIFCREEGFEWLNRYMTGLLISPNKTVQGIYDLLVFPNQEPRPSRRRKRRSCLPRRARSTSPPASPGT